LIAYLDVFLLNLGMKVIGFVLIYENYNGFGHIIFILALDYEGI
jgi:hypothetical protein